MKAMVNVSRKDAPSGSYMDPGVLEVAESISFCCSLNIVDDDPKPFIVQHLTAEYGAPRVLELGIESYWTWDPIEEDWVYVCRNTSQYEVDVDSGTPVVVQVSAFMQTAA